MKYLTRKDIYKAASKEAGISEQQMEFMVKNFFSTIRSFLVNPLDCWRGILIEGFIKYYIAPVTVERLKDSYKKDIMEQIHQNLQKDEEQKKNRKIGHEESSGS